MDEIGKRLRHEICSRGWRSAFNAAFIDAARIAERVRIEMGLDRADIAGEPASSYLSKVLDQLQQHAEIQALKGYGRYRWIWYLRRLPPEVWMGDLSTTGPYDRSIAEILATRGAGPSHCLGEPFEDGTFPIDGTVIRRIAWVCGYTKAYRHFQVAYRIVGKGGVLTFDQQTPGLGFSVCRTRADDVLDHQIQEYDRRCERQTTFSHVGVPIEDFAPESHRGEPMLLIIRSVAVSPEIVTPDEIDIPASVALRFIPSMLLLRELEELLTHPSVIDVTSWSPELPLLVTLLSLATFFYGEFPLLRCQLLMSGYMIIKIEDLDELVRNNHQQIRDMIPLLKAFVEVSPCESFSNALLSMEGNPSPRLPGPIAFMVKSRLIGIDLYGATNRLLTLLEFPSIHGRPANVRARAFERMVQESIDRTAWAPAMEIRKLIGHQFKRDGKWIGEVDAFASQARTLLLVSCKSVIQRAEYDRGDYAAVRNARTMLENAAESVCDLARYFQDHPGGGSEYDFTRYDTIVGVVVTPQVMFVKEPLLFQESLPGLRTYSGFDEFQDWVHA